MKRLAVVAALLVAALGACRGDADTTTPAPGPDGSVEQQLDQVESTLDGIESDLDGE